MTKRMVFKRPCRLTDKPEVSYTWAHTLKAQFFIKKFLIERLRVIRRLGGSFSSAFHKLQFWVRFPAGVQKMHILPWQTLQKFLRRLDWVQLNLPISQTHSLPQGNYVRIATTGVHKKTWVKMTFHNVAKAAAQKLTTISLVHQTHAQNI